jgi:hypothetical protein
MLGGEIAQLAGRTLKDPNGKKETSCHRHKYVILILKLIRSWDHSNRSLASEPIAASSLFLLPA